MRSSDSPDISAAFDAKVQEYFAGKLPHAGNLVPGLFDLLASNRMSPHPSPTGSSHSTITPYSDVNYGSWFQLRDAITRSLTTGIFLDTMFYVKDLIELRPLFFCSSITPALFRKIPGQCERDPSSVNLSENECIEIGKLVPVGSLHSSPERVIDSQDVTNQKVLVVTSENFRA